MSKIITANKLALLSIYDPFVISQIVITRPKAIQTATSANLTNLHFLKKYTISKSIKKPYGTSLGTPKRLTILLMSPIAKKRKQIAIE